MDNTVEVQDLGKVMITPKGEYNSSKTYEILDAVSYNGSSYVSKINDNTSVPTSDDWQLLSQKGDIYDVTEEDLQAIAKQITDNANSAFNQNVKAKTDEFDTNTKNKTADYDTNAKTKLKEYNENDTKKLKAYNDNSDSKMNAYNTNDTTKTKAYNENHKTKMQELDDEATVKIAEYDEHAEELRNMAISTDNELERVKNEILDTGSASDSFVHVEDSCMAKIKELEIEGVINQKTTTGKNLLNVPKNLQQIKSDSYSITPVYSNGMLKYIELNGTFDKWVRYSILGAEFILSSGTYIQSFHKEGTFSNGSVYIDSSLSIPSIESDNLSKVLSDDLNVLKYSICVNQGTICNNLKLYPMIAKEDKVSNYEPFTNGASPNPDYPQKIKTITDNLKITSCGKNLFDIDKFKEKITGQGMVSSIDGSSIICNGTATTTYATIAVPKLSNLKLYPGEYMISVRNALTYSLAFQTIRQDGTRGPDVFLHENRKSERFKVNELLTIASAFLSFMAARPTLTNFTISDIQIERANTVSEYENYVESLITAKLSESEFIGKFDDTYKDIVRAEYFPEEGQYHLMLDKMIGHKNFNNETTILYSELQGDYFLFQIIIGYLPSAVMISNNFINKSNYGLNYNYESIYRGGAGNKAFQFKVKKERVASYDAAGALSFIKNSNTEAYYVLATPYTVDLGPIDMPLNYKGITNIFTDSDLLPTINAKYYRTFEKTILNMQINEKSLKQEITDLNNNISDITKRLEALESANVSTVEESEVSNDLQN